ncbi:unnamed protein product, partial [Rotaria magnacalcarata]
RCTVNNGGCGSNATCSYNATTKAVTCNCKGGYTNTGSSVNVVCTGMMMSGRTLKVSSSFLSFQIAALSTMEGVVQTPLAQIMLRQMQ